MPPKEVNYYFIVSDTNMNEMVVMVAKAKRAENVGGGSAAPARKGASNTLRSDLKRFTRERLEAAALQAFATDGFRASTVERIVELAGTTQPTFYRHFASKKDLLEPLQAKLTDEVRKVFLQLDDIESLTFLEIRPWIERYAGMWQQWHQLCAAYWEAAELNSDYAAEVMPASLNSVILLTRLLSRYEGEERRSIELRLGLLIPLLDRLMQVALAVREPGLGERLLDEFAQMLVLALRHPGRVD